MPGQDTRVDLIASGEPSAISGQGFGRSSVVLALVAAAMVSCSKSPDPPKPDSKPDTTSSLVGPTGNEKESKSADPKPQSQFSPIEILNIGKKGGLSNRVDALSIVDVTKPEQIQAALDNLKDLIRSFDDARNNVAAYQAVLSKDGFSTLNRIDFSTMISNFTKVARVLEKGPTQEAYDHIQKQLRPATAAFENQIQGTLQQLKNLADQAWPSAVRVYKELSMAGLEQVKK